MWSPLLDLLRRRAALFWHHFWVPLQQYGIRVDYIRCIWFVMKICFSGKRIWIGSFFLGGGSSVSLSADGYA